MPRPRKWLRRRALRLEQDGPCPLYQFSLTGDELLQLATISRVARDDSGDLVGYQRTEVKRHVKNIVDYLESEQVLLPNSLVIALTGRTRFQQTRGIESDGLSTVGMLSIPLPVNGDPMPGWVVDGQQRMLAIANSTRGDMPVPVNAFVTDDVTVHRDQFLRVNSSKPLPRGLLTELLPKISGPLPDQLSLRKTPSAVCDTLNALPSSPFYKKIRRPSTPKGQRRHAVITDSSIVKMVEDSLSNPNGCLFTYHNMGTGETDYQGIWQVLYVYWTAVKNVFPEAWGLPPSKSRLMHGAGIRSMGKLMDRVMATLPTGRMDIVDQVEMELAQLKDVCRWTSGTWSDLGLRWNEVQNVPRHIRGLSDLLIRNYLDMRRALA